MMNASSDLTAPTPESIAAYVKRHAGRARKVLTAMHAHGPRETVREVDYQGHHIVIGTTYRIEVDGRPVGGHFIVTDDGQVQCHALPNYTFSSAVDLVKSMIDVFPEDFSASPGDGGHDGGHDHGGHQHDAPPRQARRAVKRAATSPSRARKPAGARRAAKRASKGGRHGRH
jgi:hypothetical protein